jgi:hypothetical protein
MNNNAIDFLTYIKYDWNPLDYKNLLVQSENFLELFQMILNIVLVKIKARQSTLIELNNFYNIPEDTKQIYEQILKTIIRKMKMVETPELTTTYRYFITNNMIASPSSNRETAKILDFKCINDNFSNPNINRVSYSIIEEHTNEQISVEVGEEHSSLYTNNVLKFQQNKVKKWNKLLHRIIPFPYTFVLKVEHLPAIGFFLKPDNYTNLDFVQQHIDIYIELLYNYLFDKSLFTIDDNIIKHFDKFIFIMDNLPNIQELYSLPCNTYPSDNFNELIANLKVFDYQLINSSEMEVWTHILDNLLYKYKNK